jgi:hypothetical protein
MFEGQAVIMYVHISALKYLNLYLTAVGFYMLLTAAYLQYTTVTCKITCPGDAVKFSPFNAGIKSLRATLPDEIFLLGILLLELCISLIYA